MFTTIESVWAGGDLAEGLKQAGEFVAKVEEKNVRQVVAYLDPAGSGGWYVDVVYDKKKS